MINILPYDSYRNPDLLTEDMKAGYVRQKSRLSSKKCDSPFMPLSPLSQIIAETFYRKFLDIWFKEPIYPYIEISLMCSCLKIYNARLIHHYFPEGRVYYNQFFQFVCSVSLLNFNNVVYLMLSACKIYSNVFITDDQLNFFLNTNDAEHLIDMREFCKNNKVDIHGYGDGKTCYSLKAFISFIQENIFFKSVFTLLQSIVNNEVISIEYKERILDRYSFYNCRKKRGVDSIKEGEKPSETCVNKLVRIISNKPHPFHYDYCITKSNSDFYSSDNCVETLILYIKQVYGYGSRNSHKSKTIRKSPSYFDSSFSLKSSRNTSLNTDKNELKKSKKTSDSSKVYPVDSKKSYFKKLTSNKNIQNSGK